MNERKLSASILAAYDRWLRQDERADATREKYLRSIRAFAAWLGGAAVTTLLSAKAAVSFLVFTLLYTPCVAAIAAIRREVGSAARAATICVSQCCVAWLCAFAVYTLIRLV